MKTPLVSIIMPVFNASLYIRESINSVLQQSFCDFEFIIIDDGSTDDSVSIVETYNDNRIQLILKEHNFIDSLNTGMKKSKGKYIARMDADDIMLPNRLQIQYDFMEFHPEVDICGSWAEIFGAGTGVMQTNTEHEKIIALLLLGNQMIHPSIIMKSSILEQTGKELYKHEYPCAEDYKLWTDLTIEGFKFTNIPEVLLNYRRSEQQVTQNRWQEMMASTGKIRLEYGEQVMEKIVEKDSRYEEFFNLLIELFNNDLISMESLLQIIYRTYVDILKNND